jgi:large repetitive protein
VKKSFLFLFTFLSTFLFIGVTKSFASGTINIDFSRSTVNHVYWTPNPSFGDTTSSQFGIRLRDYNYYQNEYANWDTQSGNIPTLFNNTDFIAGFGSGCNPSCDLYVFNYANNGSEDWNSNPFFVNSDGTLSPVPQINFGLYASATINEGDTYTTSSSISEPISTSWTATVDYGDGLGAQPLSLSGANFSLSHLYPDNGTYWITVTATDNQGRTGSNQIQVTVNNVAPTVDTFTVSNPVIQINNGITTSTANFTDPGVLDTHTAIWDWGDGNTTSGTVSESNGSGTVSAASHTYTTAGVYTITLTVTDKDGGAGTSVYQYEAAYDPTPQGIFTGARLFNNPSSASPSTSGQVQFGIVAKYSGSAPSGNASMNFPAANLKFVATSISTLVIANGKATLQGSGTVNGTSGYTFSAVGMQNSYIRFQIKDSSGTVVYDTQPGAALTTDPTTSVTGQVIIH